LLGTMRLKPIEQQAVAVVGASRIDVSSVEARRSLGQLF